MNATSKSIIELPFSHALPCHLTDQQIIGLMTVCFHYQFVQVPSFEKAEVSLFVRQDGGTDWGFEFWFQAACSSKVKNYQGTVFGADDLNISMGCFKDGKPVMPLDWEDNFSIPVKAVYQYLQGIHYFSEAVEVPIVNPALDQPEWQLIYRKHY